MSNEPTHSPEPFADVFERMGLNARAQVARPTLELKRIDAQRAPAVTRMLQAHEAVFGKSDTQTDVSHCAKQIERPQAQQNRNAVVARILHSFALASGRRFD